jgi:hypothetical protein
VARRAVGGLPRLSLRNLFSTRIALRLDESDQVDMVLGRRLSKSFLTRGLADSYRAELVRAARQGLRIGHG